ncbi:MAG: PKD domain-containing protein [Bacteroidales bacterium]|nr:PKD domain-containing protein [Bacteroidales bacterium]TFH49717.1 MAG: PKD domain-containing protein [Bacteroidia bacterium]
MKRILILTVAAAAIMLSSCDVQPDAYFFSDKIKAEIGEEVLFFNGSHNATEFEWDFGDGTWSDAYEPAHSYSASGIFTVVLSAYSKSGNVDRSYLDIEVVSPTMLEIEVLEWYDEYPVAGASVILYPTETDWDKATNPIIEGFTNSAGKVVFTNLGPYVYYIDVWHATHNNYTLRNEDVDWIRTDQLQKNQLNRFVAWVDYTGTKSAVKRDRTQLLPLKERTTETAGKK